MTQYSIFRTTKLNHFGNVLSSLHHTFRTINTPNADGKKTKFNRVLCGSYNPQDIEKDIKNRISEITNKPRKDAVLTIELLQTFSPDSNINLDDWTKKNIEWNKQQFGEKNVISSVLHLDETTPHIVTYVVPEKDGRLNCKAILGGREKLSNLQTSYANSMKEFGLSRGVQGSKSKHQSIKKFYSTINKNTNLKNKIVKNLKAKIDNPPEIKWYDFTPKIDEKVNQFTSGVIKDTQKILDNNSRLSIDNNESTNEIIFLKDENEQLKEKVKMLENKFESVLGEENLSQDDIAVLKKIDISLVAARLNYFDEIPKRFTPIDLVKKVNNFNFEESINWLANEFDSDVVGAIIANEVNVKKPERPFTKTENKIKFEIIKQLDALGCDKYRLTLQSESNKEKTFVPGKRGDDEKFYSKKDIINMIPFLLVRNSQEKMNISITPMDDFCYYILVDDCEKTIDELEKMGYQPCLYQQTSWNSYQAVFKITKEFDREKEVLPLFNKMNESFGDKKMTGLRHPFRLVGFSNMKEKHLKADGKRPFVSIIKSVNRYCKGCMNYLYKQQKNGIISQGFNESKRLKIDDFNM